MIRIVLLLSVLLGPALLSAQTPQRSLYERLGGVYPIAVVVDAFIDELVADPMLNENPAIAAARDRVPAAGLKYHVTAMVCQATGGPCTYTGRSMPASHAHLQISARDWTQMLVVFRRVLTRFEVPDGEQAELVAIVESTRSQIVTR